MTNTETEIMPQEKFLMLCVSLLHRALVEPARTEAKQVYRDLVEDQTVPLANVELEDKSTVNFTLALDHSEFRGRINYGAFRASLMTLLKNITDALREEKALKVFSSQEGGAATIFGVTAVTIENDKPNVMVLSAESDGRSAVTTLRLMYLDPVQFQGQAPEQQVPDQEPAA